MMALDRQKKPSKVIANPATYEVNDIASLMQCGPRTIWRWNESGKMPKGFKVGALVRWSRSVIDQWISDGCPVQP